MGKAGPSSDIIAELGEMKLSIWHIISNGSGIMEGLKDWSGVLASVTAEGTNFGGRSGIDLAIV